MLLFQGKIKDSLKLGRPREGCSQSGLCKPDSLVNAEVRQPQLSWDRITGASSQWGGTVLRVNGAEEVLPEATGYSPLQGRRQRILKLRSFLDLTEQVIFGCSVY